MSNRTVTPISAGIVKIEEDGNTYLGILISSRKKNYALTQFSSLKKEPGWIVEEGTIKPWYITGVMQEGNNTYFYGPYESGFSLYSLLTDPHEDHLPYIHKLVEVLKLLKERSQPFPPLYANSVLFLEDDRVLLLPYTIMGRAIDQLPDDERVICKDYIKHPDEDGEEALSFSLGVLLYVLVTGEFPFTDEADELLHAKMRTKEILTPKLKRPEVSSEVSSFVMKALARDGASKYPTLAEWEEKLSRFLEEGIFEELSEDERQAIKTEAEKIEEKSDKSFQRQTFLQKHKVTIILSAVGVVAVIWFLVSFLGNLLEPPVTLGKSPREVVYMFYTSVNNLDHVTMQDCVSSGVGEKKIKEVTHLYVVEKMRKAYEGSSGIIDAQKWIDEGRPPIDSSETIYGIADLTIQQKSRSQQEAHFTVTYKMFVPLNQEETVEPKPPEIAEMHINEQLYLANRGNYWEIYRIDMLEREQADTISPTEPQKTK
jgi:serine/threonine protein kinase